MADNLGFYARLGKTKPAANVASLPEKASAFTGLLQTQAIGQSESVLLAFIG